MKRCRFITASSAGADACHHQDLKVVVWLLPIFYDVDAQVIGKQGCGKVVRLSLRVDAP